MRIVAVTVLLAALGAGACSDRGGMFRHYEYEEEMYLSLDGTATMFVNGSVPALNALRDASLDARPNARLDRAAVRELYTTPVTRVTRVSSSRRNNRRFAHVRLEVDDVSRLGEAGPFAWSSYQLTREGGLVAYRQTVGAPPPRDPGAFRWDGDEAVAFRLHLPSEIVFHNSPARVQRGNILEWEQPLADRLRGAPLTIEARMGAESILYRTLLMFGGTLVAVAATFGLIIAWMIRRGGRPART